MALVNTKEMFKKAYDGGYAIGAFNINDMEIIQGIMSACAELKAPVILQVSSSARKYAHPAYLVKMVEAAVKENPDIPVALHLDHGPSFEMCKACIDDGFTSVMFDGSAKPYEENVEEARRVVEYAHKYNVTVEAELGKLAGVEDDVKVEDDKAQFTDPDEVQDFVTRTGVDSLAIAIGTSHGAYKFKPGRSRSCALISLRKFPTACRASRSFCTAPPLSSRSLCRWSTSTAARCPTQSASRKRCCVKRQPRQSARSMWTPTSASR